MVSYEDEGLYLDLGNLGRLQVCVRQYANSTTNLGTYVRDLHEFDGRMLLKVVVSSHKWIGVDVYHTIGSCCSINGSTIPYEWVLVDSRGVERQYDAQSSGSGAWATHKDWDSAAPERIILDAVQPTQQWELRDSRTKHTFLVMQFMLTP